MSGILATIGGVFTSGFGLFKLIGIVKKFTKVKRLIKEAREAYGEFDDIMPAVMKLQASIEDVKRHKFKDKDKMQDCINDAYAVVKEVKEFVKEFKDIVAIFK